MRLKSQIIFINLTRIDFEKIANIMLVIFFDRKKAIIRIWSQKRLDRLKFRFHN
jgi:hypothetical protein